jgi:hypothetical protein
MIALLETHNLQLIAGLGKTKDVHFSMHVGTPRSIGVLPLETRVRLVGVFAYANHPAIPSKDGSQMIRSPVRHS